MSKERDILKSLLLNEEQKRLDNLENRILSKEQFTNEVSDVLVGAIENSKLKDSSLENSLSEPINKGVTKAFSNNKQAIVDSLLPIMGQLIRKTVTNSIKQFVTDINRTLELQFSIKSLKWRMQAKKAGISYAEMIFQKTISYKVQELFVINKENGILIHHVGENSTLLDNNAISGMLTVIQDFISDSVQTSDKELFSATIGDVSYLITQGPKAYLASIVKGSATERLKQKSQELIENIHADYSSLLIDESRYQNDEGFDEYLRNHLISKSLSNEQKKINWIPWVVIVLLAIFGTYYWASSRSDRLQKVIELAESTDGFILQDIKRKDSGFIISGLLDPIADISHLQKENITLISKPFLSLDQKVVEKRARLITNKYEKVRVEVFNNTATLSGSISNEKLKSLIPKLYNVIGIESIINNLTIDNSLEIINFFKSHEEINQQLSYGLDNNSLTIKGIVQKDSYEKFINELKLTFPDTKIVDANIIFNETIQHINSTKINIPKLKNNDINEQQKLISVIQNIQSLLKYNNQQIITIIGESDCSGQASDQFSLDRAEIIKERLVNNKVIARSLNTSIKACVNYNNSKNDGQKNVAFKVP